MKIQRSGTADMTELRLFCRYLAHISHKMMLFSLFDEMIYNYSVSHKIVFSNVEKVYMGLCMLACSEFHALALVASHFS